VTIALYLQNKSIASMLLAAPLIIYRRRLEYGLINDPVHDINDEDLASLIRDIKQDTPFSGASMMYGSLRARGIKVTRERIRSTLRSIDPLGSALRWPAGVTKRRPYSVPGPNSLWHIGMLSPCNLSCSLRSLPQEF
jgi:hypothetical protein